MTSKADKSVSATYTVTVRKLVTAFQFNMYTNLKKQDPDLDATYEDDIYDYRQVMLSRDVLPLNAENKILRLQVVMKALSKYMMIMQLRVLDMVQQL